MVTQLLKLIYHHNQYQEVITHINSTKISKVNLLLNLLVELINYNLAHTHNFRNSLSIQLGEALKMIHNQYKSAIIKSRETRGPD